MIDPSKLHESPLWVWYFMTILSTFTFETSTSIGFTSSKAMSTSRSLAPSVWISIRSTLSEERESFA